MSIINRLMVWRPVRLANRYAAVSVVRRMAVSPDAKEQIKGFISVWSFKRQVARSILSKKIGCISFEELLNRARFEITFVGIKKDVSEKCVGTHDYGDAVERTYDRKGTASFFCAEGWIIIGDRREPLVVSLSFDRALADRFVRTEKPGS